MALFRVQEGKNTGQIKWLIHLKDGVTRTSVESYPHDIPQDQITSVERIVDVYPRTPLVASILKSDVLTNFFVKTSASRAMSPMGGGGSSPTIIEERIVGAFIPPNKSPIRLELSVEPRTGNVKLRAIKVPRMSKDGF